MMRYDEHFRLAHELKKHLHELMGWPGPLTHRQFKLWQLWLVDQLEIPTRDNYYQMQIACEVRRTFSKNPGNISPNQFKLKFQGKQQRKALSEGEIQEKIRKSKQMWISQMTAPITRIQEGKEVEMIDPPFVQRLKLLEERQKQRVKVAQERKEKQKTKVEKDSSNAITPSAARTGIKNNRRRK